jgi:hypothetical protein
MSKLLLMSIIIGLVVVPVWAARQEHPKRGLRLALGGLVLLQALYVFLVRVVVPRLS